MKRKSVNTEYKKEISNEKVHDWGDYYVREKKVWTRWTSNIRDTWDHEERCWGEEGKGAGEGRGGEEEAGGAAVSGQLFWQGRQKNTSHSDLISFGQLV